METFWRRPASLFASDHWTQSTPIAIGQLQASAPQLAAKHTILFEQILKDISLLTVQPPREDGEHQLERGDIDHGPSLYHDDQFCRRASIQVMGSTGFGV